MTFDIAKNSIPAQSGIYLMKDEKNKITVPKNAASIHHALIIYDSKVSVLDK